MRLFLALEIPAAARERLAELADRLRPICSGWRWLPAADVHLTLRFLGEVDDAADRVQREAWRRATLAHARLTFRIGSVGVLPPRSRARVLCVHAESVPPGALDRLARSLQSVARAHGFAAEERPFRPHLTLARARRDGVAQAPPDGFAAPQIEVEGTAVTLYRSTLSPHGATYTALERFPLAGVGLDPARPPGQHARFTTTDGAAESREGLPGR